jgi:nucleoid DNA-binding protein
MSEKKKLTKTQFIAHLAEETELSKKQVAAVLQAMNGLVASELKRANKNNKTADVTIPGLLKVVASYKPAEKEHPGKNPFTGADIIIKEKPARKVIRARALKALKDAVN